MLGSRNGLICLLVFGLVALALPVVALANGGGSAGDQQYTDPLSGTKSPTKTTTTTTTSSQAPAPTTSTSVAAPPTSSTTPTAPAPSAPTTATATDPTATTATAGTSTLSASDAKKLPYTGYDGRLAAALGFVLVLGGIGLRRRLRHR